MATVVKTAWAMVQAKLFHLSDLVFGQLVSGRNTATEHLENVIGPCVNIVPVRVQIHPDQRIAELLSMVQAQHAHSIPYETCGLRAIVKNSTSWPRHTDFGSVVHHRNSGDQYTLQSDKLTCHVDAWSPVSSPSMNTWIATTADKDQLIINIFSRSEIVTSAHMGMLVKEMAEELAFVCNLYFFMPSSIFFFFFFFFFFLGIATRSCI